MSCVKECNEQMSHFAGDFVFTEASSVVAQSNDGDKRTRETLLKTHAKFLKKVAIDSIKITFLSEERSSGKISA